MPKEDMAANENENGSAGYYPNLSPSATEPRLSRNLEPKWLRTLPPPVILPLGFQNLSKKRTESTMQEEVGEEK